jgi:FkbM family methyltransferase
MFKLNNFRGQQKIRQHNERIKKIRQHNERIKKIRQHNEKIRQHNELLKNKYSPELFDKLSYFQNTLKLDFGSFLDEYPEQMMVVKYLTGNEKVLEIGGNIGRNSLIIASILNSNNNDMFVSLESDPDIAIQLENNKNKNNLKFCIENSALSKKKLIQQGWNTVFSDILLDGYKNVNIINLEQLKDKYNIVFDTLVLDCEGAFYYILLDMPEILNNIKLIIMENDYWDQSHKMYVDNVLREKGFILDYVESGGWGPCAENFYEVWKKN